MEGQCEISPGKPGWQCKDPTLTFASRPSYVLLVHFKSRDWDRLFKFGRFWHFFVFDEHGLRRAAISQDDNDTVTTHLPLPLDVDPKEIDSHDAVYRALGGMGGPYKVEIDEILVRSTYRHSIAIARDYRSPLGRIFLAGDSAHQNIPTGGYGMNTGIGDAFDIGWKLAAVMQNKAGPFLLDSYQEERRAIAMDSIQRSGVHMQTHAAAFDLMKNDPFSVEMDSAAGSLLRAKIHDHYQTRSGENTDLGIEMDYRHHSRVYAPPAESDGEEPPWEPQRYFPSTFVGSRASHVFLTNGRSIFEYYGPHWLLIEFYDEAVPGTAVSTLLEAADDIRMPMKHVLLRGEENACKVWKFPLVLVRPDGHVAWRGVRAPSSQDATALLKKTAGWADDSGATSAGQKSAIPEIFAATISTGSQVTDYHLDKMEVMQS